MAGRLRIQGAVSDSLSPDQATCEHCGQPISWDEVCYTHDSSGFAECGLVVGGGTIRRIFGFKVREDPTFVRDPSFTSKAEPTTWFRNA